MAPRVFGHRKKDPKRATVQPAKILYRIYQAVHHSNILKKADSDPKHPLFMNKVKELDHFFRVAGAQDNPDFLTETQNANREWRKNHIKIQMKHHEHMIEFQKGELSGCALNKPDMRDG